MVSELRSWFWQLFCHGGAHSLAIEELLYNGWRGVDWQARLLQEVLFERVLNVLGYGLNTDSKVVRGALYEAMFCRKCSKHARGYAG
jgi:hypothetical protein